MNLKPFKFLNYDLNLNWNLTHNGHTGKIKRDSIAITIPSVLIIILSRYRYSVTVNDCRPPLPAVTSVIVNKDFFMKIGYCNASYSNAH